MRSPRVRYGPFMTIRIRCLSDKPDLLGESPVWDAENGCLYWVDGVSRLVRSFAPASGVFKEWLLPSMIGCVALGPGQSLVVGLVDGLYRLDLKDGKVSALFKPAINEPLVRFNDGKVDRDGRFLCGSMGIHADPLGRLWQLDATGRVSELANGIRISNALCFSPNGRIMYFADSLERRIRAYRYGTAAADIGSAQTLVDTSQWDSGPDGATVDSEGFLWVSLIQISKIARFTPAGALARLIDAPVDLPSSLAFGGPDMATLFVTSIKDSGSGRAITKHPDGGKLFAIDGLGVHGIPEARFGIPTVSH